MKCYLHVNKIWICKFKTHDKIPWYEFCLGNVSKDSLKDEMSEILLNCNVNDFSADRSAIENKVNKYLFMSI